jgi:hypothetical protein
MAEMACGCGPRARQWRAVVERLRVVAAHDDDTVPLIAVGELRPGGRITGCAATPFFGGSMRTSWLCTIIFATAFLAGCGRQTPEPVVQAPPPPPPSAWVKADSATVADELIGEMLKRPWIAEFKERAGRSPKVALGAFSDRSKGDVDLALHRAELTRALGAGGLVTVVEEGADFILKGAVGSHDGAVGDVPVKRYQIDLTLVDAKTGDVVTPSLSIEKQKDDRAVPAPAPTPAAKP